MSRTSKIMHAIVGVACALLSAGRAAGAVELGRAPSPEDLRRLGIDPEAFARIRMG